MRNPEQVVIVEPLPQRRWWDWLLAAFQKRDDLLLTGAPTARRREAGPALILAAVDLADGVNPLADAVLAETGRLLAARSDSRLSCLTVLKLSLIHIYVYKRQLIRFLR